MSKKCEICGNEVGFFSGKFIGQKYVCKACYELNLKENSMDNGEQKEHTLLLMSEAFAKPYKYKSWSWRKNKKVEE